MADELASLITALGLTQEVFIVFVILAVIIIGAVVVIITSRPILDIYPYLNPSSRVRARKGRLFDEKQMSEIVESNNVEEVENYLTARSINEAYNSQLTNDIGRYEIISDYLKGIRNDFSFVKVPFARKVAPHITKADFRDDLEEKIRELATKIKKWNE